MMSYYFKLYKCTFYSFILRVCSYSSPNNDKQDVSSKNDCSVTAFLTPKLEDNAVNSQFSKSGLRPKTFCRPLHMFYLRQPKKRKEKKLLWLRIPKLCGFQPRTCWAKSCALVATNLFPKKKKSFGNFDLFVVLTVFRTQTPETMTRFDFLTLREFCPKARTSNNAP